jgi:membrane AbrB-like protein
VVVGLVHALLRGARIRMPRAGFHLGQAIAGVTLGQLFQASALTGLGLGWGPVLLVNFATLALTLLGGIWLARLTGLDSITASLGMIAGGATGIVPMAGELGADDRLVAFMQHFRVLVVSLATPIVVSLAFAGHGATTAMDSTLGNAWGWLLVIFGGIVGVASGHRLRLPAPSMLGPLLVAGVLAVCGLSGSAQIPTLAREFGFALIGLEIGLRFDRATIRRVAGLLPPVAGLVIAAVLLCFGLGAALGAATGTSLLDGYPATTPGGLYAVLPVAVGSGANTTFVLAVQLLRLMVMLGAAPLLVRRLGRRRAGPG